MATLNIPTLRQRLLKMRASDSLDLDKFKALEQKLNTQILSFLEALELKNANFIQTIAFYSPIKGEPDISYSLLTWAKHNNLRSLAIPVTKEKESLNFAKWDEQTELKSGLYNIPEPSNPQFICPDLIIAPCLGWQSSNENFWRIGYGAGYYDRTLENLSREGRTPVFVGVCFEDYRVSTTDWQPMPHDIAIDTLITESDIYSNSAS
jgi:5-formyltetrahydrofolate cyclo-ligase